MANLIDLLLVLGSLSALFLLLSLIDALLEGWDRRIVWVRRWGLRRTRPLYRGRRRPGALAPTSVADIGALRRKASAVGYTRRAWVLR